MMRMGLAVPAGRSWLRATACQNCRMKMPPGVPGPGGQVDLGLARGVGLACARCRRFVQQRHLPIRQGAPGACPAPLEWDMLQGS